MKHYSILGALAISLFMSGSLWAAANQDFSLANKTGYTIKEIYVSPSKANDWGDDILGKRDMPDGVTLPIHFSRDATPCHWDLKVVYDDDDTAEWDDIDLCTVSKIKIRWNKKSQESTAEVE